MDAPRLPGGALDTRTDRALPVDLSHAERPGEHAASAPVEYPDPACSAPVQRACQKVPCESAVELGLAPVALMALPA